MDGAYAASVPTLCEHEDLGEEIAAGTTAIIKRLPNGSQVAKLLRDLDPDCDPDVYEDCRRELQREYAIYNRLPRHPRLLYLEDGSRQDRLLLPFMKNGTLKEYLNGSTQVSLQERLVLAADAAKAVEVLHRQGIVHGDIQPSNFMLDNHRRLCIIDFAGATVDTDLRTMIEAPRYFLPRSLLDPSSPRTDLFALGGVLYFFMTGKEPYDDIEDEDEILARYGARNFPSSNHLACGHVIQGCWESTFASAQHVYDAIMSVKLQT